jgi:hypothetical protein
MKKKETLNKTNKKNSLEVDAPPSPSMIACVETSTVEIEGSIKSASHSPSSEKDDCASSRLM